MEVEKKFSQKKYHATPLLTPTVGNINFDKNHVTSSSTFVVMVTLFSFFLLIVFFCCFQRCRATTSCEVKTQTKKEEVATHTFGTCKKKIPIVFDGASATKSPLLSKHRRKVKSRDNKTRSFTSKREDSFKDRIQVFETNRPPPPPYLSQKTG